MTHKTTEESSYYRDLEKMGTEELLHSINQEDKKVADVVAEVIPQIKPLVATVVEKMKGKGRLFYIGSGTSGRLGILDASECPPTFGVDDNWVIGLIAGGDGAIRKAQEFAEDDTNQAWKDLNTYNVSTQDVVVGLSASGSTPYVLGGLKDCREQGIQTGCITCNKDTPIAEMADFPVVPVTGPEFVTGSTRMKAGTAQKLILNMISTAVMVKMGRIQDNKMVDMQLTNEKLIDRGSKMIKDLFDLDYEASKSLLLKHGSVRKVIEHYDFKRGTIE